MISLARIKIHISMCFKWICAAEYEQRYCDYSHLAAHIFDEDPV